MLLCLPEEFSILLLSKEVFYVNKGDKIVKGMKKIPFYLYSRIAVKCQIPYTEWNIDTCSKQIQSH